MKVFPGGIDVLDVAGNLIGMGERRAQDQRGRRSQPEQTLHLVLLESSQATRALNARWLAGFPRPANLHPALDAGGATLRA
jgi:hypothetical protein